MKNSKAEIDYTNSDNGTITVMYTATTESKIKICVKCPSKETGRPIYIYDLLVGKQTTLVLSEGSGEYTISVMKNTTGTRYASVLTKTFIADIADETAPFLASSNFVDYSNAPNTIAKAEDLAAGEKDNAKKIENIFSYVIKMDYDHQKARSVKSGYVPVLDSVLEENKGICFDYAALMAGMLRSQGIPCKMIFGYMNNQYHSWVSVWDGENWVSMDPTAVATSHCMRIMDRLSYHESKYY